MESMYNAPKFTGERLDTESSTDEIFYYQDDPFIGQLVQSWLDGQWATVQCVGRDKDGFIRFIETVLPNGDVRFSNEEKVVNGDTRREDFHYVTTPDLLTILNGIQKSKKKEKELKPQFLFIQPFLVNVALAEKTKGKVVVLDIAFNGGSPLGKGTEQEQFENTTIAFINALGDRLVGWIDHHPHKAWENYENDPRFILVPREQAPACPPLITPDLVNQFGEVDTIIAHDDFDGVMSAIKYALSGSEPYEKADEDSIASDSRIGTLSPYGQRLENAMKAALRDDSIRQAIVEECLYHNESASKEINLAQEKYAVLQEETQRLVTCYEIYGRCAFVDAFSAAPFDYTALLLAGQEIADVAVVRDSINDGKDAMIGVAGPPSWDFVKMFGLSGGMKNRVNLPDQNIQGVIDTINNSVVLTGE